MSTHHKLDYVEFGANDLEATKTFFNQAFGWSFTDYGPDYTSFADEGLDGGFFRSDKASNAEMGGALLVFYSDALERTLASVKAAGATINKEIFPFPGGRRFHFVEPSGNEFAVWGQPVEGS